MLGAPARRIIGTVQPLLPETGSGEGFWREFVASLHNGNGPQHEMRLRTASGHLIPVEVSANLMRIGGRAVVQSIVQDVTERKHAEKMLHIARDQALEASSAKSQFVAN